MRSLLTIVLTHTAVNELAASHEPYWLLQSPHKLVYIMPDGAGMQTQHEVLHLGCDGFITRGIIQRARHALRVLACNPDCSHLLLHEYDSVCVSPDIALTNGFTGIYCPMVARSPDMYLTGDPLGYHLAPWLVDRESALAMLRKADAYPDYYEGNFTDRYLSALARLAGVPLVPHSPPGYGDHTNHRHSIAATRTSALRAFAAALDGATMFHGVKTQGLAAILQMLHERTKQ